MQENTDILLFPFHILEKHYTPRYKKDQASSTSKKRKIDFGDVPRSVEIGRGNWVITLCISSMVWDFWVRVSIFCIYGKSCHIFDTVRVAIIYTLGTMFHFFPKNVYIWVMFSYGYMGFHLFIWLWLCFLSFHGNINLMFPYN